MGSKHQLWRPRPALLGFVIWLPFLAPMVQGGETNSVANPVNLPIRFALPNPQRLAAQHERAGRKREAAALYETTARTNIAARKVLSHRLITIYAEIGETNKALALAREVMRDNPDPQAYLAAVYARLGQWKEAHGILEREIAVNTNLTRAVTLRWQLAEVCAEQGDADKAHHILNQAAARAKGTSMEATTQRRLKTLDGGTK